jgi:hypothetical protein
VTVPVLRPTFAELVTETVRELEARWDHRLLEMTEAELLRSLADFQHDCERNGGYSIRSRATAAGAYEFWRRHGGGTVHDDWRDFAPRGGTT